MADQGWAGSLRGRLLRRGVVAAAVPLVVMLALLVVFLTTVQRRTDAAIADARASLSRDVVAQNLVGDAENLGRRLQDFLSERLLDVRTWVEAPALVEAIAASAELGDPYRDLPIAEVEAIFDESTPRRLLTDGPAVDFIEGRVTQSPHFGEAILTDADGLVVAATNQTSDFVQRDEDWWEGAVADGVFTSDFRFDESADVFSLDLAIAVGDPAAPVGVVKTVLAVSLVQQLADEAAELDPDLGVVVADQRGLLLADTASGHAPERILRDSLHLTDLEAVQLLADAEADAVVSPSVAAAQLVLEPGRDGLGEGWTVLVVEPASAALAPLAPVTDLQEDLSMAVSDLLSLSVVISLLGLVLAGATTFVLAARVSRPLTELRDAAAKLSDGDVDVAIPRAGTDELGEIARALQSLAWAAKYVTRGEQQQA